MKGDFAIKPHVVLLDVWRVINSKGGTDRVFCNMANELTSRGYEVTALCYDKEQGRPSYFLNPRVELINTYSRNNFFQHDLWRKIHCFSFNKNERKKRRIQYKDSVIASSLAKCIKKLKPVDIYISFEPEGTYILRKLLGVTQPVVTMYHFTPSKFVESQDFCWFYKDAVTGSSLIQVLMPEYVSVARSMHPGAEVIYIPNTVPQSYEKANLKEKK